MFRLLSVVALLALAGPACASQLAFDLKTPGGGPVADAVVTFRPAQGAPMPTASDKTYTLAQEHIHFIPHVLVVPVGAEVTFPNRDKVRHHVYSFSTTKKFELKLYGKEETRSVHFDKAGVAAIGCNIHDSMSAFIYVADTPYAAVSDAAGHVVLNDAPPGPGTLTIWHAQLRQPRNALSKPLTAPPKGELRQSVTLELREAVAMPPMS